jgi:hypothetical protein
MATESVRHQKFSSFQFLLLLDPGYTSRIRKTDQKHLFIFNNFKFLRSFPFDY